MAATAEAAIPTVSDFPTEVLQRPQVAVDRMVCETAPQDAVEPPALLGHGQLSSISQFLAYGFQLNFLSLGVSGVLVLVENGRRGTRL